MKSLHKKSFKFICHKCSAIARTRKEMDSHTCIESDEEYSELETVDDFISLE